MREPIIAATKRQRSSPGTAFVVKRPARRRRLPAVQPTEGIPVLVSVLDRRNPMSTTVLEGQAASADLIALEERYGAHNYHPLDVVVSRAEGVWVWDVEGKKYLDFLAAYSAVNQGHCHPAILRALIDQASSVTLSSRAFRNAQLAPFYPQLCEPSGFAKFLPMNTGAEAVETAVKTARKWAYKV